MHLIQGVDGSLKFDAAETVCGPDSHAEDMFSSDCKHVVLEQTMLIQISSA